MHRFPTLRNIALLVLFIFVNLCLTNADEVYSKNKKANTLYKQGKHGEALKLYDDALLLSPNDNKLKMNKGSALYKTGQFDKAEELYNAALSTDDKKLKSDAAYNLGNILYKEGEQLQSSGNPQAKEKYQAALQHYIQALDYRPDDNDAKWNLQLAHARIKQAEQQQKQQQNKNDKNNKQQNEKNNQGQNKNDQKDQQNKDKQNQDQQNKDNKQNQDNKQDQNNKNKQDQNQNKDNKKDQQQQQNQAQMKDQNKQDMKKDEARRLLELYSDDADSLNKPQKKTNASHMKKPEQDW